MKLVMLDKKAYKILIVGSFGSGKTTFVKTLSEIDPVMTEKKISRPEERIEGKDTTTVAMDMGKIKVSDDLEVHLFATPGQKRFNFMIDILKKGIIGTIVMVDATNPNSIKEAEELAKYIRKTFDMPVLFAVTKLDMDNAKSLQEIKTYLETDDYVRVIPLDPRNKEEAKRALMELLSLIF